MAPRRVAFVSQCLGRIVPPRAEGSIAILTYEVARRLRHDHDVLLIEYGEKPLATEKTEHEGVRYVYLPTLANRILNAAYARLARIGRRFWSSRKRALRPPYASPFHNLGFALQAAWQARKWRSEVVHVHNFSQFVPLVRALNPRARIVLHMNCEWLSQHDPQMIRRRIRSADVIAACSGHVLRRVAAAHPEAAGKCEIVFNGADVGRFSPGRPEPEGALRILFVGRVSPEKGVHLLVEAFNRIADAFPTAVLDLVGGVGSLPAEFLVALSDDPLVRGLDQFYRVDYFADLQRRIPDRLRSRILFHGNQDHAQLVSHYRRAYVFVNPSLSDAFPLTVVEAMAAGLPVVASAVGGVPEAIVDGVTGMLVRPDDADALASALAAVLGDRSSRERMAGAARARAEAQFSWDVIATRLAALYAARPVEADRPIGSRAGR
jgi:glycosyltransferase involved in cell wall biosynthesis